MGVKDMMGAVSKSYETREDLKKAFDAPGLLEKLIPFEKEIAVIAARNELGEVRTFPCRRNGFSSGSKSCGISFCSC